MAERRGRPLKGRRLAVHLRLGTLTHPAAPAAALPARRGRGDRGGQQRRRGREAAGGRGSERSFWRRGHRPFKGGGSSAEKGRPRPEPGGFARLRGRRGGRRGPRAAPGRRAAGSARLRASAGTSTAATGGWGGEGTGERAAGLRCGSSRRDGRLSRYFREQKTSGKAA